MSSATVSPASSAPKAVKYGDFSRNVNDFFGKEFPFGFIKVEARTFSRNPFISRPVGGMKETFSDEFKVVAVRNLDNGAIAAEVKNTTSIPLPKLSTDAKSVTTLTSSNVLTQQLTINNIILDGLKLDFTGGLQPSGSNSVKAMVELNQGFFVTSTTVEALKGPVVTSDMAARFRDFQLGGEASYDVAKGGLEKYSVSLSLDRSREKAVFQALTGFRAFSATYYQKFNDQLEVAFRSTWSAKVPTVGMEVGAKYYLLGGGFLKAKLDNAGRLAFALASDLRPGVQITLGATVDTAKLNDNNHKLGLELVYSV